MGRTSIGCEDGFLKEQKNTRECDKRRERRSKNMNRIKIGGDRWDGKLKWKRREREEGQANQR